MLIIIALIFIVPLRHASVLLLALGWNLEVRGQREWFCNHLSVHTCFLFSHCIFISLCPLRMQLETRE